MPSAIGRGTLAAAEHGGQGPTDVDGWCRPSVSDEATRQPPTCTRDVFPFSASHSTGGGGGPVVVRPPGCQCLTSRTTDATSRRAARAARRESTRSAGDHGRAPRLGESIPCPRAAAAPAAWTTSVDGFGGSGAEHATGKTDHARAPRQRPCNGGALAALRCRTRAPRDPSVWRRRKPRGCKGARHDRLVPVASLADSVGLSHGIGCIFPCHDAVGEKCHVRVDERTGRASRQQCTTILPLASGKHDRNRGPGVAAATATVINLAGRGPAVPQEIRKNELRASRHKSVSCLPENESGSSHGKKKNR